MTRDQQPFRSATGGRVDRSWPLAFTFDGKQYAGARGDTLASALLANGVHLVARSFKYHRPRGIMAAGSDEPNALVTIDRGGGRVTPNTRATEVELYDGLVARSQNRWPSLGTDVGAVNGLVAPLIPAGFYYKTFMGPREFGGSWVWTRVFEPVIRRAAGLGTAPSEPDPDRYAQRYAHCDVLVVGAGPAGLAAASAAAEAGASVILCDERPALGGSLLDDAAAMIGGRDGQAWAADAAARLAAMPNATVLPRTTAFGYFAQNFVALAERLTDHLPKLPEGRPRERLWQVRASAVVLATGAHERPLVFPGNDRPGVMLAGAARAYLHRHGVLPGTRAVVFAATDDAYAAALDLHAAGLEIVALVDPRPEAAVGAASLQARAAGVRVRHGEAVVRTHGTNRISSAEIASLTGHGATAQAVDCDCLLMSAGWTPSVHLFSQARGTLRHDAAAGVFLPGEAVQRQRSAGACNGSFGLREALAEGAAAGAWAAGADRPPATPHVEGEIARRAGVFGLVGEGDAMAATDAFVDFQNDVTARDIVLATREGMRSIEHVKRYTTAGMATDQGKSSNMNALAIAAAALGRPVPEVGLTTFRQPYTPTTFGTFAGVARGDLFEPVRRTPIDPWARAAGAIFENVGLWQRARAFPRPGETMHTAVTREVTTVRRSGGLFDASTLGKIEVTGPDAAAFLDRMYVNDIAGLAPGRCRYALMLNEAGFVMDDGIVARLAPDRFHVTTTTGGAAHVLHHMEDYLQTEFPAMRAWLTSVTEQWATIAVQGPRARAILAPFITGTDLDAMPHMSVREVSFAGLPCRLFRVSFTGEPGFEVNVPADMGAAVWEALLTETARNEGTVYGTEAMHVLRAEKGHIIIGQETDGTVVLDDLGLARMAGKTKPDFVGKRGMQRPDLVALGRKQLVGLLTADPKIVLDDGAQVTATPNPALGTHAIGHVTSSYYSPSLFRSIALALVENGRARHGETLYIPLPIAETPVTVVDPVFFDKEGLRIHG